MEMAMEFRSKTVAPASAREKGKEPAIQIMGNKMIHESSSSFASSKGKESAIDSNSAAKGSQTQNNTRSQFIAIGAASSSSFATGKMAPAGFGLETKSHPLRPNNNNNIDDIFQIGQSSFSKNVAYSNSNHQYSAPPPDSNSSFGKVGGSRSIPGNYQMNTSVQISSSLFHNTEDYETESGSSFSSLSANSNSNSINNAISTFSLEAGIANSIGINSRFSGFAPSMIEHPMGSVLSSELGSNFPYISMMEQSWMGGFGWGIPSIDANANPARLGSTSNSFFPMVAMRPAGSSFSFPSVTGNPTELDSRFPMMISNPRGPGTNFSNSRVGMVTPTEPSSENPMMKLLDSSFLSMLTNPILEPAPTEFGSIFSSRIANANPNRIGPGSSSSLTLNENPMPQPSGSSFSSVMAKNPMNLGIRFNSTFDESVDSGAGTSLSLSYDNSINTDFSSSSVLENSMDLENST